MSKHERIDRLSDYREQDSVEKYYIEVSDEATKYIEKFRVRFYFSHHENKLYLNGSKGFTRYLRGRVEGADVLRGDTHALVSFSHIDPSCTRGELQTAIEMVGEWLDEQVGQDYGWSINNRQGRPTNKSKEVER